MLTDPREAVYRELARCLTNTVPADADMLEHFAEKAAVHGIVLPPEYLVYLKTIGRIDEDGLHLLGVSTAGAGGIGEVWPLVEYARETYGDAAAAVLPLDVRPSGHWVCLELGCTGPDGEALVSVRVPHMGRLAFVTPAADGLTDLLRAQIPTWHNNRRGGADSFAHLAERCRTFADKHGLSQNGGGRLPSPHEWRPLIYRVQDVMLAGWVWRYSRSLNSIEVDAYAVAAAPELEPYHGQRVVLLALASEASRCGEDVGVRFGGRSFAQGVPEDLVVLANELGVSLASAASGVVAPDELRMLSLRIGRLSPHGAEVLARLHEVDTQGFDALAQAFRDGTWAASEVDYAAAVGVSPLDNLACTDRTVPEPRAVRVAGGLMTAMRLFRQRLAARDQLGDTSPAPLEDAPVVVTASYDAESSAWLHTPHEAVEMPWLPQSYSPQIVPAGSVVASWGLVGPREFLAGALDGAIEAASGYASHFSFVTLVLSRDYSALAPEQTARLEQRARSGGVFLTVAPYTAGTLEADAARRRLRVGRSLS